jgi:hypothetical protein
MARERIVLRDATGQRSISQDLVEQTRVGDALLRGLIRAQLALALRLAVVVCVGLGGLPLLFWLAPPTGRAALWGIGLPWLLLGVLAYPFLYLVGYAYVRLAEQNERDFTALVRRRDS